MHYVAYGTEICARRQPRGRHRQSQADPELDKRADDDAESTEQEVTNVIHDMGNKNAPGEDGIPNEVWKGLVKILPKYVMAIYNKCLKEGVFLRRWKQQKLYLLSNRAKKGAMK